MSASVNVYDVGTVLTLTATFLTGPTLGSITSGQNTLLVRDASGLTVGGPILVAGAGAVGGDLSTTVSGISGQTVTLAANAGTTVTLVSVGQPTNPTTVACKVRLPDLSEQTLAATLQSTGKYTASFTITLAGNHFVRWSGTGAAAVDGWRQFVVRPERVP